MTLYVVAHDAGGAEILAAHVRNLPAGSDVVLVADGPAGDVFQRSFRLPTYWRLQWRLSPADVILTGTSVTSNLERDVIVTARDQGARTISWLDHWKNYRARFVRLGALVLPDELWVTDNRAFRLARDEIPEAENVVVAGNPYMDEVVERVREATSAPNPGRPRRWLYVSEPGRDEERERFLAETADRGILAAVRLHPTEGRARVALADQIAWADVVVGCDSMALAIAASAGKKCLSMLPRGERTVPSDRIETF